MALSVARGPNGEKQAKERPYHTWAMSHVKSVVAFLLMSFQVRAQLDLPPYADYGEPQTPEVPKTENQPYNGDIKRLLQALDVQASQQCTNNVAAQWNFETNANEHTQLEAVSAIAIFISSLWNGKSRKRRKNWWHTLRAAFIRKISGQWVWSASGMRQPNGF